MPHDFIVKNLLDQISVCENGTKSNHFFETTHYER